MSNLVIKDALIKEKLGNQITETSGDMTKEKAQKLADGLLAQGIKAVVREDSVSGELTIKRVLVD